MVLLLVVLGPMCASAQTLSEFIRQKATQKKYLLQQIAALEVYIGYAKKGYQIVGGGVNLVKDISSGEFGLHQRYFASLASVNPLIKNGAQVAGILEYQLGIASALRGWEKVELNDGERRYVMEIKAGLIAGSASDLEELLLVISDGKLEMTDEQRITRLKLILGSMEERYGFVQSFSAGLVVMAGQKAREQRSINEIRRLYEIN